MKKKKKGEKCRLNIRKRSVKTSKSVVNSQNEGVYN